MTTRELPWYIEQVGGMGEFDAMTVLMQMHGMDEDTARSTWQKIQWYKQASAGRLEVPNDDDIEDDVPMRRSPSHEATLAFAMD